MGKHKIMLMIVVAVTILLSLIIICFSNNTLELNIELNIFKAHVKIDIKKGIN